MVLAKAARLMLPNRNESEDDVKVAPRPKLQIGHHPIQRKKGKSNPHCSCWSSWSLPVAGQLRPSTSPHKAARHHVSRGLPWEGGGFTVEYAQSTQIMQSFGEISHFTRLNLRVIWGRNYLDKKKKRRKTTWNGVFCDMWIHVTSPISSRPSWKMWSFPTSPTTKAVPNLVHELHRLFRHCSPAVGLIASQPSEFLLGEELAQNCFVNKKRLGKMVISSMYFEWIWGMDCEWSRTYCFWKIILKVADCPQKMYVFI